MVWYGMDVCVRHVSMCHTLTWHGITFEPQMCRHLMGYRTVPVEIGSHYLTDDWGQQLLTVNEFIDQYLIGSARSEEHTSELQSLLRISYAVFCLKKKTAQNNYTTH